MCDEYLTGYKKGEPMPGPLPDDVTGGGDSVPEPVVQPVKPGPIKPYVPKKKTCAERLRVIEKAIEELNEKVDLILMYFAEVEEDEGDEPEP